MKLALYSELADKDPKEYYSQYLKQSKDDEKKSLIALQLVRMSKTPAKDLETYKPYFKNNMGLYARAALDIYGSTQDRKLLEKVAKEKGNSKADAFVMIEKILLLGDMKALRTQVAAHKIDTKNQKTLAAGLKERVKLLEKVDAMANKAIASGDWSSQLLSLDLVSKENHRFYEEVLSLPMPEGLTGDQEQEYLGLLSQQVAPNQNTAAMADTKVKEFWAQPAAVGNYRKFMEQNTAWSSFISEEVAMIASIAPVEQKATWSGLTQEVQVAQAAQQKPSLVELEKARTNLKQNPFQMSALQEVLALEKKAQRKSMVEYIESRIATLAKKDTDSKEMKQ